MVKKYALSLRVFKKKFGLSTSQVRRLAQKGIIEIQQSGYPGDSKNHHKLVAFPANFVPPNTRVNIYRVAALRKQLKEGRRLVRLAKEALFTLPCPPKGTQELELETQISDALLALSKVFREMEDLINEGTLGFETNPNSMWKRTPRKCTVRVQPQ